MKNAKIKTSNKVLLGVLIAVIVIPFFVFLTLKSKIRKGQFTVASQEEIADLTQGGFSQKGVIGQKYIIIKGAYTKERGYMADVLTCHLHYDSNPHYAYHLSNLKDSISIKVQGDTTYISFVGDPRLRDENGLSVYYLTTIDLYLPRWNGIRADGASVIIDDMENFQWDTLALVRYDLDNTAKLLCATNGKGPGDTLYRLQGDNGDELGAMDNEKSVDEHSYKSGVVRSLNIPNVEIVAKGGQVFLGDSIRFNQLALNLSDGVTLEIDNAFSARKVTGLITDDVRIKANAKSYTKLMNLLHVR